MTEENPLCYYHTGAPALRRHPSRPGAVEGTVDLLNDEGQVIVEGVPLVEGDPRPGEASFALHGNAPEPAGPPAGGSGSSVPPAPPGSQPPAGGGKPADPVAHFVAALQADPAAVTVEALVEGCTREQLDAIAAHFEIPIGEAKTKADVARAILGPEPA